ncbi:DUF1499 domain-containing protein [Halobacillus sp. BBL2006]|uniref:DUF1499 domain-containing protein n=1 Tax=Halobacillus sp. BBL2006 TaxID=1543706 RepID=UPI000541B592|nr:DUF1499 domain-containing protein [Halobacillus sp. BBL2006]KHE72327.1 hypothetical protein LD39_05105 [Halobacillus sp. BBL2006]
MSKSYHGVKDGQLADCPNSPNCVSTQTKSPDKQMKPLPFNGELAETKMLIRNILEDMERTSIEMETDTYIHAVVTTKLLKFKDDVEFYLDEESNLVHYRSASRVGYSDFGVNRKRMEQISEEFKRRLKEDTP